MNYYVKYIIFFFILPISLFAQDPCGGGDDGGGYGQPTNPDEAGEEGGFPFRIPVLHAFDPNDITGDLGYDSLQWVSINDNLGYMIRFENDPDFATAPAQKVIITMPVDSNLNIYSFRLNDFGFGAFHFQVPPNSSYYTQRLDVRDSLGIFVDVVAGINVNTHEAFWIFESIDPLTGLPPEDALVGFLPVNDTTINRFNDSIPKAGEGFVSFSIDPIGTAITGDSILAQASIVFDINAPITTNIWKNVIDAFPPNSTLDPLPDNIDSNSVLLTWTGQDDIGGVGIDFYDLYVSKDGGTFVLYEAEVNGTSYSFTGDIGSTYSFYTLATDYVGNQELPKGVGEDSIRLGNRDSLIVVVPDENSQYCLGDSINIEWTALDLFYIDIAISTDSGQTFIPIDSNISALSSPYVWQIPTNFPTNGNYIIQLSDTASVGFSTISAAFTVHGSDTTYTNLTSCNPADTGVVMTNLQNQFGCDSILIVTTTLLPSSNPTYLTATSCNPQDTGTVTQTLMNIYGCDSLVITTTNLSIADSTFLTATTCNPADTGIAVVTLNSSDGCDSVVTTVTTLLPNDTTYLTATSCNPADVGQTSQLLQNGNGCDSLVITTTSLLQSDTTYLTATSCNPNDVGQTSQLLQNGNGCDSLVITTTTLLQSDTTYLTATSCNPSDVGQTSQLLQNGNGCDSLVITTTSLLQSDTTYLTATSCNPNDVGQTSQLLQNGNGCDSLVITTTTLLQSDTTYLTATSCNPVDVGQTSQLLQNGNGCDSLVITTTSLLQSDTTYLTATSCNPNDVGQNSTLLQNGNGCDSLVITTTSLLQSDTTYLTATSCNPNDVGQVSTLLQNGSGCDSLVITTTSLLPSDTTYLTATSCDVNQVGIDTTILSNIYTCDSLVITTTILLPNDSVYIYNSSCNPMDIGTVSTIYTNQFGCDSTVFTITNLLPSPVVFISNDTTVCPNEPVQFNVSGGVNYIWISSLYLDNPNISNPIASVDTTTTFKVAVTNQSGCTVIDSITITIYVIPDLTISNDTVICVGDTISLNTDLGYSYNWSPSINISNTSIANPLVYPDSTTTYTVEVTTNQGCVITDDVIVTVNHGPMLNMSNDFGICFYNTASLATTGATNYLWTPGATLNDSTVAAPIANPSVTTTYYVTGSNTLGCTDYDSITITVFDTIQPVIIQDGPLLTVFPTGLGYTWFRSDTFFTNPQGFHVVAVGVPSIISDTSGGYYRVRIADNNGCEYESETIYVPPVSTDIQKNPYKNVLIKPNPADDFATIIFEYYENEVIELSLFNGLGQLVTNSELRKSNGFYEETIDLTNMPAGIYSIMLNNGKSRRTFRLIIAK